VRPCNIFFFSQTLQHSLSSEKTLQHKYRTSGKEKDPATKVLFCHNSSCVPAAPGSKGEMGGKAAKWRKRRIRERCENCENGFRRSETAKMDPISPSLPFMPNLLRQNS